MRRSLALCAAALALAAAPCRAQLRDTLARGEDFFLTGKLEFAINFFSGMVKENPKDSRAREILGYCLVIKGKEALREGNPGQALASLDRAKEFLPRHGGLKTLALLAELEESAPTPSVPVSTATLDTAPEVSAVLDCFFGEGECAKGGRYSVHVVREGETMAEISLRYYNDLALWEKIWAANPQLANPHRLEKGMKLLIPLDK